MAKKKDAKKAKKDAWRAKKRAEAGLNSKINRPDRQEALKAARESGDPLVAEAAERLEAASARVKETGERYAASREKFREADKTYKEQRQLTLNEGMKIAQQEAVKLRPHERSEFHRRFMRALQDATRAGDETTDWVAQVDFDKIAADVKASMRGVPDTRKYQGQQHDKPEDQSLESYLEALAYTLRVSRQEANTDRRAEAMRMYVAFREARVFHIGQETYAAVHAEADRYTTEMAGLEYQPPNIRREVPYAENVRYVQTFMREAKRQAWPEKFPFPVIFLGYGKGVVLPLESGRLRAPSKVREDIVEIRLLGHLLTAEGHALTFLQGGVEAGVIQWCDEARTIVAGWTRGLDLEPWTLPHLVRIINDHRTFVLETELSGAIRRSIKENRKPLGLDDYKHMPKPYYTLRLQTHVIRDKVRKQLGRPGKPKSYKTDVRGHERCRIRRGPLPIDPKLADKLQKRGYAIFSTNTLDPETFQRLSERGAAFKRADEWLAVKATWVKDHLSSNNPNLPYIPAMRVAKVAQTEPQRQTGSWTDDPASR